VSDITFSKETMRHELGIAKMNEPWQTSFEEYNRVTEESKIECPNNVTIL
jgi:hypothetical protein